MTSKVLPNRLLHSAILVTVVAIPVNRNPSPNPLSLPGRADRGPATIKTLIGADFGSARIAVGLRLAEFAKKAKATIQTLSRIELGPRATKTRLLARIAHSLGSRTTDVTAGT